MGVIGLTTFIDKNSHLLCKHELKDCSVVIDGNNLCHHIYKACRVEAKFGGDYDVYRQKLQINFKSLLKCGVTPYVVLDGGYTTDNKKLKKCIQRAKDRIRNAKFAKIRGECQILPLLAHDTFMQTLDELNIPHVTCQFEADCEIAKLANKLQCPVVSNDSDFYIFDLTHGFLPLDYLDFNILRRKNVDGSKSSPFLHCQYYNIDNFLDSFEGLHRSMLPVLATLLGNDYSPPMAFQKVDQAVYLSRNKRVNLSPRASKVMKLIHWLRKCSNDTDNFMDSIKPYIRAQKKFISSVEGYSDIEAFEGSDLFQYFSKRDKSFSFVPIAASNFAGYNGSAFPTWFLLSICKGQISPALINAAVLHRIIFLTQVENLSSPSSHLCSEHVRKAIYGILLTSDPLKEIQNACVPLKGHDESSSILSDALQSVIEKMELNESYGFHEMNISDSHDSDKELNKKVENNSQLESEICNINQQMDNCSIDEKLDSSSDQEDVDVVSDCDDDIPAVPHVRKQSQFEEYHREQKHLRKTYLDPVLCVGGNTLPTLCNIGELDKDRRLSILLDVLEVDASFVSSFSESLSLYMVSITTWIRHANPSFTQLHLDCAILCPILLHMLNPVSSVESNSPRKKNASPDFVDAKSRDSGETLKKNLNLDTVCEQAKSLNKNKYCTIRDNLDRYRTYRPVFSKRQGVIFEPETVHAFAQLQSCMFEISNLNKLLRFPLPNIQPAFFINGSFLYNFYTDLISRPVPANFLEGILLKGSDIHSAFLSLKTIVLETTSNVASLAIPVNDTIKKRRKKKKGKGKSQKQPCEVKEDESQCKDGAESEEEVTTLEGFDVQNKFSLLPC